MSDLTFLRKRIWRCSSGNNCRGQRGALRINANFWARTLRQTQTFSDGGASTWGSVCHVSSGIKVQWRTASCAPPPYCQQFLRRLWLSLNKERDVAFAWRHWRSRCHSATAEKHCIEPSPRGGLCLDFYMMDWTKKEQQVNGSAWRWSSELPALEDYSAHQGSHATTCFSEVLRIGSLKVRAS